MTRGRPRHDSLPPRPDQGTLRQQQDWLRTASARFVGLSKAEASALAATLDVDLHFCRIAEWGREGEPEASPLVLWADTRGGRVQRVLVDDLD